MAIKLGEKPLIQHVIEHIPPEAIKLCVTSFPDVYAVRCLRAVVAGLEAGRHVEFYLIWAENLLTLHGSVLKGNDAAPVVISLQKNLTRCYDELSKL